MSKPEILLGAFFLENPAQSDWSVRMSDRILIDSSAEKALVNLTFDNSSRHLQRFWGASGDFWQNLWTKLYLAFEGHDAALFYFGK